MEDQNREHVQNPDPNNPQEPVRTTPPHQQTHQEIDAIDSAMQSANTSQVQEPTDAPQNTPTPAPSQESQPPEVQAVSEYEPTQSPLDQQDESGGEDVDQEKIVWRAAEPIKDLGNSFKPVAFIGGFALLVVVGLFVIGGVNFSTIVGAMAVILGVVALFVTSRQHGHLEEYFISSEGVSVGGSFYSFSDLKSYGILKESAGESIELVPTQRFMPRIILHLEPTTADNVVEALAVNLPREDREPDFVDRIYKSLGM